MPFRRLKRNSFLLDFKNEGVPYAARFTSSVKNRLWFHEQVLLIAEEKLGADHALVERFKYVTEMFRKFSTV